MITSTNPIRRWALVPAPVLLAVMLVVSLGSEAGATKKYFKQFRRRYPRLPSHLKRCETCHMKKGQSLVLREVPPWMLQYTGNEKGELPPQPPGAKSRRPTARRPPRGAHRPRPKKRPPGAKPALPVPLRKLLLADAKSKKPHNFYGLMLITLGGKKKPFSQRLDTSRILDADGDGYPNEMELATGRHPADPKDKPTDAEIRKAGLKPPPRKNTRSPPRPGATRKPPGGTPTRR